MKYTYTKVEDAQQEMLQDFKSLMLSGSDTKGHSMTVEDALTVTNNAVVRRTIEEIVLAPVYPNLIGSKLVSTTFVNNPGRTISIRSLGALDMFNFAVMEEGEYPEISASKGQGSLIELRFNKYGCKFKVSEELIEYSNWDMITYQLQQVAFAMARYRDKKIMETLFGRGFVVYDNRTPNASLIGRTTGRNISGAGNGSMTQEDLIDMYAAVTAHGYTPRVILCHPLHWAMFAKDPILRESGIIKGDLGEWLRSTINTTNPYGALPNMGGARRELTPEEAYTLDQGSKPQLPSYSPLSGLTVLTSPLVPYDPVARTADLIMIDPDHTAILAFSEYLTLDDWDEKRNDLKVFKFREKWGLEVKDNGRAIAVARNISLEPNELFVNPQVVMDNIVPIKRKD